MAAALRDQPRDARPQHSAKLELGCSFGGLVGWLVGRLVGCRLVGRW